MNGTVLSISLIVLLAAGFALTPQANAQTTPAGFQNPLLWEDLPDLDVIRVGDTFYYSASTMHYSPGAPVLSSKDLVHWNFIGHSVPTLDFGPGYDLTDGNAYVRGVWASFLGYRKASKTFYWGGCIDFKKTYLYTAPAAAGPWQRASVIDHCYYDAGLLVDDDDTMYVAYGRKTLSVAQLSPDGTHEIKSQPVFETPDNVQMLEGSRFYKIHGAYYIFTDRPPNGEFVLKSTTGPFGPYTMQKLVLDATAPVAGAGSPHQGGIVQTQHGDWFYMAFIDAYPGGRVPVLAPVTWSADGWPSVTLSGNTWAQSYPYPLPPSPAKPLTGTDRFPGPSLAPDWEWNHNPDNSRWSAHDGLTLMTATVTEDLYAARDTLTRRTLGPRSTATVELNVDGMHDGDRAGLALLRDSSAWIGIERDGDQTRVVMQTDLTMSPKDRHWTTISTGTAAAAVPLKDNKVWLRATADVRPGAERQGTFAYSTDGNLFHPLGTALTLKTDWHFFMGYRYGIFNYATKALGGKVTARSFSLATP